jgi:hypothetical protein
MEEESCRSELRKLPTPVLPGSGSRVSLSPTHGIFEKNLNENAGEHPCFN